MMNKVRRSAGLLGAVLTVSLLLAGCTGSSTEPNSNGAASGAVPGADGCTPLVVATSSEKVNLVEKLGATFKDSAEAKSLDECVSVFPINVSSGNGAKALIPNPQTWPELGPEWQPTIWSPASSVWIDRVAAAGNENLVANPTQFTQTPIVFGVPESMAKALDYPNKPISYKDLEANIANPGGWGALGKPLWGSFKIAKTNPNTSTTGLSVILSQSYAASGKADGLTVDDVNAAKDFSRTFESGAIHYGDTTGKVLTTLYNATQNGKQGSSYVSAIALEETSLFWYNKGNPDSHTVQPGETLTPPKEKLVAVYPTEGSMWSDNPAVVLNSPWVTEEQKVAGAAFLKFLNTKPAQSVLPEFGFRPLDGSVDVSNSLNGSVGIDPAQPTVSLPKPSAEVVSAALDQWTEIRKPSAVLEVIDISGSMDDGIGDGRSKLDGAIEGAVSTLNNFRSTDEIGVWAFTTEIESDLGKNIVPVYDFGPLAGNKEQVGGSIEDLAFSTRQGTPLYDAIGTGYDYMNDRAESGRINAMIVLSDGQDTDSKTSLDSLLIKLNQKGEGSNDNPVRIFTIAYGDGADKDILQKISTATGGQMFDATDPKKIQDVFQSVVNNF
jgi:Ca-activated chloride channel family protein